MMKKIVAFCEGDSLLLSTWSNVPFLCLQAIETNTKSNYSIKRIDISCDALQIPFWMKIMKYVYSKSIGLYRYLLHCNTMIDFSRTLVYQNYVLNRMNKYMENYQNAYAQLIFSFSHITTNNTIPTILLCDWSIEYKITEHWKRIPTKYEQIIINRQWDIMERSDAIVTLFPHSYDLLKKRFGSKVHYMGQVINAVKKYYKYDLKSCYETNEILFIGKPAYKTGLECLIHAVNTLNHDGVKAKVNVIGMTRENLDCNIDTSNCNFYGYLNKSDPEQCEQYYKLLKNSKMLVNVTESWNGASSILEAIYYGLPVIISKNEEMKQILSVEKSFVFYCKSENKEDTISKINAVLKMNFEEYIKVSKAAHEFANQYTWNNFSEKLLALIDKLQKS